MTTRLEYLKKCITSGKVTATMEWYTSCFAIPHLNTDNNWNKDPVLYKAVTQPDGLYYIDIKEDNTPYLVKIVDHVKNQPLFTFQELIDVDNSWLATIPSKIQTKIGVLILNAVVLFPTLGTKLEYLNKKIKVSDIEQIFVNRVKNKEEAKDNDILVSEMVACVDRLTFLSNLATIVSIASTPKIITPPPGIQEAKKELLKEYKDLLNDPVKVVELESKLTDLDKAYLADDPAADKVFTKKSRTARKKMYLMFGEAQDFVETPENRVIIPSLSEGIDTSEENFPKYMNDLRSASYSRGASTALSGYTYKILQRSLSGLTISQTPCNTNKGFTRLITESNYKSLIGRYLKTKGWTLIEDNDSAKSYIGKNAEIRSMMYCTSPGNTVCYQCVSHNYKGNTTGITNMASNMSSALMNLFLKRMHGGIVETIQVDMKDYCS